MNLYKIVEQQVARAEPLIAGYLGLYAGSIDLADLNPGSIKQATPEFKRCVQLIQDLAAMAVVTPSTVRKMEAAVDALAGMVRAPQMMAPTRALWAIEDRIRRTRWRWFVTWPQLQAPWQRESGEPSKKR